MRLVKLKAHNFLNHTNEPPQLPRYLFEDVKLIYTNFSGREELYNDEGKRKFDIVIDDPEIAKQLLEEGWNVKEFRTREEGDPPVYHMTVKISLNGKHPPEIYMVTGNSMVSINEDRINNLDNAIITNADVTVRPWEWKPGKITAYLVKLYVTIEPDYLSNKYANYIKSDRVSVSAADFDAIGPSEDDGEDLPF